MIDRMGWTGFVIGIVAADLVFIGMPLGDRAPLYAVATLLLQLPYWRRFFRWSAGRRESANEH